MGFGCREEPEGYRVGPFTKGDVISDADVEQMDRYLVRTWIEVCLFLESYRLENREHGRVYVASLTILGLPPVASEFVHAKTFGAIVDDRLQLSKIPECKFGNLWLRLTGSEHSFRGQHLQEGPGSTGCHVP